MELEERLSRIEERAGKFGGSSSDVHAYFDARRRVYAELAPHLKDAGLISEANWLTRRTLGSSQELGIHVRAGDICYVDFGASAYLFECGFQHFALIVKLVQYKALVIPMTPLGSRKECSSHRCFFSTIFASSIRRESSKYAHILTVMNCSG